jgi:hypothetical protein
VLAGLEGDGAAHWLKGSLRLDERRCLQVVHSPVIRCDFILTESDFLPQSGTGRGSQGGQSASLLLVQIVPQGTAGAGADGFVADQAVKAVQTELDQGCPPG